MKETYLCETCGTLFDAEEYPECPECGQITLERWGATDA